jgi:predicted Rossmann fold nucleotide-binding protein DprA/Smf involved in DNA uptake
VILHLYDLARGLRDAGVAVIGGFHSPMEKECLELLMRGRQPIVICPARSIEGMRLPPNWRKPIEEGRLLVLSPFRKSQNRPTLELTEQRNHLAAELADTVFVAHATAKSKTEGLCRQLAREGKTVWTFAASANEAMASLWARSFTTVDAVLQALSEKPHPMV